MLPQWLSDFAVTFRARSRRVLFFVYELSERPASLLSKIVITILRPWRRLLEAIRRGETNTAAKIVPGWSKSARYWVLKQILRLAHWVVYWIIAGPIWLLYFFIYAMGVFLFIAKPFSYTEWVGMAWITAIIVWATLFAARANRWSKGPREVFLCVAIGLTPQFLFLLLYNGLSDVEITPPALIQRIINSYELAAVWLYTILRPIKDIEWEWWAAAAAGVLGLSLALNRPGILTRALLLRKVLASAIFIGSVTVAVCLSTAQPVGLWQPDVQVRLKANLQQATLFETKIALSLGLIRWFQEHPGTRTELPAYVRNIESAEHQIEQESGGSGHTSADIGLAAKQTIEALVPENFGDVLANGLPAAPSSGDVSGSVSELLRRDADMKRGNRDLELKAEAVRRTATALIAQVIDVPVSSVPLLKDMIGEMINSVAEIISERIAERLPVEQAILGSRNLSVAVSEAINGNLEAIFNGVFRGRAGSLHARLDGARTDEVKSFMEERTSQATEMRVEQAREAEVAREVRVP
jgi:hypothetical protein